MSEPQPMPPRDADAALDISILIPVYNEEAILEESVRDIVRGCDTHRLAYELLLCENGSKDRTAEVAQRLCQEFPQVQLLRYPEPNYGGALKAGILAARGRHASSAASR